MAGVAIGLALFGLGAIALTAAAIGPASSGAKASIDLGWGLFFICLIGTMASTWVTNILRSQRQRR
jgi:hypothetical protein